MNHHTFLVGFLALALTAPVLALGDRYTLPQAMAFAIEAEPDTKDPGIFTLTAKVKALVTDLAGGEAGFRLPPTVEAIGDVTAHKGTFVKDKAVTLKAKVRLKPGAGEAVIVLVVSHDFDAAYWLKYILDHEKGYPQMPLRDLLYRETQARAGKPSVQSKTLVLERGK